MGSLCPIGNARPKQEPSAHEKSTHRLASGGLESAQVGVGAEGGRGGLARLKHRLTLN